MRCMPFVCLSKDIVRLTACGGASDQTGIKTYDRCCPTGPSAIGHRKCMPTLTIRWQAQRRATNSAAPKHQGGDMRLRRVEERRRIRHSMSFRCNSPTRSGGGELDPPLY